MHTNTYTKDRELRELEMENSKLQRELEIAKLRAENERIQKEINDLEKPTFPKYVPTPYPYPNIVYCSNLK